jgi:glycosyltransferase involved in cell wall biosynthesis
MARRDARAMITVAFDARETTHMSAGVLNYSRKLRYWLPRVAPDVSLRLLGGGDNFDLAEQIGLPLALARSGAALAHFPTLFVPRFIPLPYIVTVHDLIDLHFPQFVKKQVRPYVRAVVAPVCRGARAVITDDEATVADLERFLGVDPARVRVIALGNDAGTEPVVPARHARPYVLYVGNRRPHKNLATLVAAWSALPAEHAVDLVLSGIPEDALRGMRGPGEIVFLGERTDDELRRWYAGAAIYAHPAQRILGDAAQLAPYAQLVDALDVAGWSAALRGLLDDPAAANAAGAAAQRGTAELTWERTARLTADVYRAVAG